MQPVDRVDEKMIPLPALLWERNSTYKTCWEVNEILIELWLPAYKRELFKTMTAQSVAAQILLAPVYDLTSAVLWKLRGVNILYKDFVWMQCGQKEIL